VPEAEPMSSGRVEVPEKGSSSTATSGEEDSKEASSASSSRSTSPSDDEEPPAAAGEEEAAAGDPAEGEPAAAAGAEPEEEPAVEVEPEEPEDKARRELDELQEKARVKKNELLLSLADFENTKKRFAKERASRQRTATTSFLRRLVDVYTEFDELPAFRADEVEGAAPLREGVTLTRELLASALEKSGAERVLPDLGQPPVPARHEVVGSAAPPAAGSTDLPTGSIVEIVRAGWVFELRSPAPVVLRRAQVKVAGAPGPEVPASAPSE